MTVFVVLVVVTPFDTVVVTVVVVVTGGDPVVEVVVTTVMVPVDVVVTVVTEEVFPFTEVAVVVVVELVIGAGIEPEFGVNAAKPPPTSIWPFGWRVIAFTTPLGSGSKLLSRLPSVFSRAR
jgi:hypothetical protein